MSLLNKKIIAVVAETYDDFQCWQAMYAKPNEHYILISRPFYDGMVFDDIEFDETADKVPKQFWMKLDVKTDKVGKYRDTFNG